MKSKVLLFILSILFISGISYAAIPVSKVVKGIEERFHQIQDLQAKFEQTNKSSLDTMDKYQGRLFFKKPQNLRITYSEPNKTDPSQVAISDGKYLWVYTAELKQITRQKINPTTLPLPLLILGGVSQIDEEFRAKNYIKPIEKVKINNSSVYRIIVKPRVKDADFNEQILWVDVNTFLPVKAEIKDNQGNISSIYFKDVVCDLGLSDSLFYFERKKGISYVELPD